MNERNEGQAARRPYHKPQLEEVQLVAEEAILKNCKNAANPAGKKGACTLGSGGQTCKFQSDS
jgi:hypothetical protein